MKVPNPLEITTYAGTSLGGFDAAEARPPKSAKLVAIESWSWSPANSRCDRYLICTDRNRKVWSLWAMAYDDSGRRMYALMASATPYRGYTAKHAAEKLSVAAGRSELEV
jgi:hypothetical protein